jgi:uncharacterized protein (TIGR03066 family)
MSKYSQSKRQLRRGPQPTPTAKNALGNSRRWVLLGLCLLGVAGGTWAVLEFVVWNAVPSALVGKWEVVDGPPEYKDATFEFHRSGKMAGRLNDDGMLRLLDATVRVEDDKIYSTTRHRTTGQELTTVHTIVTLGAREFVVEDQKGKRITMRRAD